MGDMGDIFKAMSERNKERNKERKECHRDFAVKELIRLGITYTSKNFGAHLIIKKNDLTCDFWPGTGLWIFRNIQKRGRGIHELLKVLES